MTKRRTTEEFIRIARNVHGDKYDYSLVEYKNKEGKVNIICPIHGIFPQKASLHLLGSGCPVCSYISRGIMCKKTRNEFIFESNKKHNNFYSYEKFNYINSHTKGIITCPIHGDFEQKPNDHLTGKGCPKCNMSYLEREVYSYFKNKEIEFEYQKKFEWLGNQSLDFYLPQYNIAIECQGKQHFGYGGWTDEYDYEYQKKLDINKNNKCRDNGIKLIYFTHFPYRYDDFYTSYNIFDDLDDIGDKILHIQKKTWVQEISDFYDNLVKNVDREKDFELFFIDLTDNSEIKVENGFELKRMKNSRQNGRLSIHVFEDEWLYKRQIVESRIKNLFQVNERKIYARQCEIKMVLTQEGKKFLNENHIQGSVNSKYQLGLYYNDELVSMMTFGDLRKNLGSKRIENEYELLRFCNKLNTTVIGGASKLFKYFINIYKPSKVISYCDLRWSNGNMYEVLGFKLSHISRPNYFYIDKANKKRENRFKYRKDILVKDGFDSNKSEHEIMLERGIYRIFDCGCKVYIFESLNNYS